MNHQNTNALRIQIHILQNHAPSNLNRDDLGAPKTCYFGGVLRSRISSQCLKRSIRLSEYFKNLRGGIRTRRLAEEISRRINNNAKTQERAAEILKGLGLNTKEDDSTEMLVYTTAEAIQEMANVLQNVKDKAEAVEKFKNIITQKVAVPDMALCGRMLETGQIENTTVEAALQAAHAISTHEARVEVDYYVAADDVRGKDAGAGYVDEAMFASACYYKYFSIDWQQLLQNLAGFNGNRTALAAHTVAAFIKAAAEVNPTGKQNSYAAHNPPDGILVELRPDPLSYANAFARPVDVGQRDLVGQSVAQLAQYILDMDAGYGALDQSKRFWFSPNDRYRLQTVVPQENNGGRQIQEVPATNVRALDKLINAVLQAIDPNLNWAQVQQVGIPNPACR